MLLQIVNDINKSLDNDCFLAALSLALTLPDICGKAKFPNERSTKKRYIDWYDEYIGLYEKSPDEEHEMPYLSGEVVYGLRCSLLHQGTPNIEADQIQEERCQINHFVLLTEKKKKHNVLMDSSRVTKQYFGDKQIGDTVRNYEVNVRRLCSILTACAKGYYEEYKNQFDFFECNIVDLDERYEMMRQLNAHKERNA